MKLLATIVLGAALVLSPGCIKWGGNPSLTPAQQVSVSTNQVVAAISSSNSAIASLTIKLQQQSLTSADLTNAILSWNRSVAQAVMGAETILKSPSPTPALVARQFSNIQFPAPVAAFLKSNPLDQGITGLISTIVSVQQLMAGIAAGGAK